MPTIKKKLGKNLGHRVGHGFCVVFFVVQKAKILQNVL